MDDNVKYAMDATSISIGVGTLLSWLPHIAAILTILWTAIRIYETKTVQRLLGRDRRHRQGDVKDELEGVNVEQR